MMNNTPLYEPELHVIGELTGADIADTDNAFCSFHIVKGKEWLLVGGTDKGQTQVDYPDDENDMAIWNHPIDVHYYSNTMQGWPKLVLEVWKLDKYGGKQLLGYSFCTIPTSGGQHELEMSVWRPMGTPREELYDFFLGGVPHLVSKELVHNVTKAKDERVFISTKSMGKVYARVEIVLRNLKAHGVRTR